MDYKNHSKNNGDKRHLLLTIDKPMSTNIEVIIRSSQREHLPGIKLDSTLLFENHVKNLCTKASQTLHAHARVVSCMDLDKQKCLIKAFVICYGSV